MDLEVDGAPPHKRRRLTIATTHPVQTPPFSTGCPEREGYYAGGVDVGVGVGVGVSEHLPITSAGRPNYEDQPEQEPLECCYGMVRVLPSYISLLVH